VRVGILVLLASVAAGCAYHGATAQGDDDDDDDDTGGADARTDATQSGPDGDGDGTPDATDNCPAKPNPDQANEDSDGDGDACDSCPALSGAQLDGDSDGVGNGCDPHPTTPGDELLVFDGFSGGALDPAWVVEPAGGSGSWEVTGGELVVTVGEPAGIALRQVGASGDTLTIDSTAMVTAVGPDVTRSVALLADADRTPLAFDFCAVSFDSEEIELYRYENATWSSVETAPTDTPMGVYTLRSRTTTGPACTVNGTELSAQAIAGTGDHVGFRVRNASVRFAYIAIYRSP
jgi:hypothetical protein